MAPGRVQARNALSGEFFELLPYQLLDEVAEKLPGDWMPIEQAQRAVPERRSAEDDRAELLRRLAELEQQFQDLKPVHGSMGHNLPSSGLSVSADETEQAIGAISKVRAVISGGAEASVEWLNAAWEAVRALTLKLGGWLAQQINVLICGTTSHGGSALGKNLDRLVVVGVALWANDIAVYGLAYAYLRKPGGARSPGEGS
ncbi:MAG: hypothetical protein JWR00_2412 [Rubritepida sp.]|nr:hypothetical protein [Rubritepida sp.]